MRAVLASSGKHATIDSGCTLLTNLAKRRLSHYALFSTLTVMALIGTDGRTAHALSKPVVVIKMLDMPPSFQPPLITINVGDTVKWENVSNSVHHATNDPSDAIDPADVTNPPGAKPFDSHFIQPGESFTHTFTVSGIYKYVCAAHEMSGMTAEVVVK
jgi:plastocyanin